MGRQRLRAIQPRAYTPRTTDSTHGLRCAPNRLLDQPKPTRPNQVWISDSTYLPLASGQWAYLCAFQDACTRQVVGWRVLDTMPEELVTSVLLQALLARQPAPGLVVHSDRGGQYCANTYRVLLDQHGGLRSQSRRDECLKNAQRLTELPNGHLGSPLGSAHRVGWQKMTKAFLKMSNSYSARFRQACRACISGSRATSSLPTSATS